MLLMPETNLEFLSNLNEKELAIEQHLFDLYYKLQLAFEIIQMGSTKLKDCFPLKRFVFSVF